MKTHTFRGKRHIVTVEDRLDGVTVPGEVMVNADLTGKAHLETCVHEAMHACWWQTPEAEVTGAARDIARFLWRLGYRRK
jgi:hypothetical protein